MSEVEAGIDPLTRVRMLISYDGKPFRGFAHQPFVRTVAGDLREALAKMLGSEPDITCAGRTDAGVHAWGQVAHFDAPKAKIDELTTDRIQQSLNKMLSPAIVIRNVHEVGFDFDARHSATARLYHYDISNAELPNPATADRMWWVPEPLDFELLYRAAQLIIGEHDFSSFCRRPNEEASLTRLVMRAEWIDPQPDVLRLEIEANAFCHQMVRALTGMMVAVGSRKRTLSDMKDVIEELDRTNAAPLAPPHGLTLWEVSY